MAKKKLRDMTAEEYAKYRVEMTRRELMKLLAKVELGTEVGFRLQQILEDAIDKVEALAEDAAYIEED